jgi:UDP-glucose 4-epimerase
MSAGEMRSALVIGGNGFLGSYFKDVLVQANVRVTVLSPHPELFRPDDPQVRQIHGHLEIGSDLDALLAESKWVIHVGSSATPASVQGAPAASIGPAVGSNAWLAERCREARTEALLYVASGGTIYGAGELGRPHRESDPLRPVSGYGALSAGSEVVLRGILAGSATRLISLRVANAYGERQNPARQQGIVVAAGARLLRNESVVLYGDGTQIRDFIHAADVARLGLLSLEDEIEGPINCGSGEGISIAGLLERMERVAGRKFRFDRMPARPFDVHYAVLDASRALQLGWTPQVNLDAGLLRTWRWLSGGIASSLLGGGRA